MSVIERFQLIGYNDKVAVVRKMIQSSTPDFDFFYLVGLSVLMATLVLHVNSTEIVKGSILIAPLRYPILGMMFAAMISFSFMNLHQKQNIASSTIKREDECLEEVKKVIEQKALDNSKEKDQNTNV